MLEAYAHYLDTPLGTYTFDRYAGTFPRAYITEPADDLASDAEVSAYQGRDLAHVGDRYYRQRVLTLRGVLEADTVETYLAERQRLRGFVNSLARATGLLRWEAIGIGPVQAEVRRWESPEVSAKPEPGGMLVSLVAPDPRYYSQSETIATVAAPTSSAGGVVSPMTSPHTERASGGATTAVTNQGDYATSPVVEFFGPITSPRVTNVTTGETIVFPGLVVNAGDWLEVDMGARTVRLNGQAAASRYAFLDAAQGDFWDLAPGVNAIVLGGTGYDVNTTFARFRYRAAYMP